MESGQSDEAIKLASEILDDDMDNPWAMYVMVRAFNDLKRPGLAAVLGKSVADKLPNEPDSWNNLGLAFLNGWDLERAIECFEAALALSPNYYPAVHNIAQAHNFNGQPEKGLSYAQMAHEINPDDHSPVETMGYCNLQMQRWTPGWSQFNVALGRHQDRTIRCYGPDDVPVWDGNPDKTVVLYGEQGMGDEIVFTQYVPEIRANLIIETCQAMYELFKNSFDCPVFPTRYVDDPDWVKDFKIDAKMSMSQGMEMYRYKNELFTGKPHLKANPEKRKWWRAILDQYPGRKIGISWSAGLPQSGKRSRSLQPEDLLPILKNKRDTFVCLEYLDASDDLKRLEQHGVHMLDFGKWINGHKCYDDTAALVSELDLVICPTTTVQDLAGGLGVPAHVFVPEKPFWRQAGKNVWYKSVKWIHQKGTWAETVQRYVEEQC